MWAENGLEAGGVKAEKKKKEKKQSSQLPGKKQVNGPPDCLKTIDRRNMSGREWESWSDAAQSCTDVIFWMWNTKLTMQSKSSLFTGG